jgi:DNA-binding transcriptional MerR regulator
MSKETNVTSSTLPEKSADALRTIGEVAEIVDVPQHVLRFWESKFPQIAPKKSRGRRYYGPEDIQIINRIKHLLYKERYTIAGVKQYLLQSKKKIIGDEKQLSLLGNEEHKLDHNSRKKLKKILQSLHISRDKLEIATA